MAKQLEPATDNLAADEFEAGRQCDDPAARAEPVSITFERYRRAVAKRCGSRPRGTERYLPRQPQKIAP
jgi:hypothetical protein